MIRQRRSSRWMATLYVILTAAACYSAYNSTLTKYKAAAVLFAVVAFIDFCLHFDTSNLKVLKSFFIEYFKYIFLIVMSSLVVYIADTSSSALMERGAEKILYQIFTILIAIAAAYEFKEDCVLYTYYGFALFNFIAIFLALKDCHEPLGQIVSDLQYFISSGGEAIGFFRLLEIHEVTFSFGLFLIYFIVTGFRKNLKHIIGSAFFFILGFKRIGIGAVVLCTVFYLLTRRMSFKHLKKLGLIITVSMVIGGFAYVVYVRSGLFVRTMEDLHIDLMGRQNLYRYIENYYRINPLFFGHGFESIREILKMAGDIKVGDTTISRMSALHNDYLAMFIEMGFFGFLFWEIFQFVSLPLHAARYGKEAYYLALLSAFYMGFCFMTDNISMYFLVCIVRWLLPMATACKR